MRIVHLTWQENPCGPRPDYYIVHKIQDPESRTDYQFVGKTAGLSMFSVENRDSESVRYIVRAVNEWGVGPPADYVSSEKITDFEIREDFFSYTQNGVTYSGELIKDQDQGPSSLTVSVS